MNTTRTTTAWMAVGLALFGTAAGGCGAASTEDDVFDDEKAVTTASALDLGTSSSELGDLGSMDPTEAARSLATSSDSSKRDGCRTRTVDPASPNVVNVTLDGCTKRFGRHVLSGHLTVTLSSNPDGSLHAETKSSDLTVDGRPLSRKVSADITVNGDERRVVRRAEQSGTKPNGDEFVQTRDELVVINKATRCRTVNGTGRTVVGGTRTIVSTLRALETCETAEDEDLCPTGSIEHVNQANGKTVVKTFDGSTTATVTVSKPKGEKTSTWSLACTPR